MNLLLNDNSRYSFFRKENAVFLDLIVFYSHTPQGCSSDAEAIVEQCRLKGTEIDLDHNLPHQHVAKHWQIKVETKRSHFADNMLEYILLN